MKPMRPTLRDLTRLVLAVPAVAMLAPAAAAGPASQVVREATEFVLKKFGKEAAPEGAEVLAGRIAAAAVPTPRPEPHEGGAGRRFRQPKGDRPCRCN